MSENILVPVLGESVTEATVARWLKKEGEHVAVDEPVVELETDKVNLEVPSPVSGVIEKINSKDGENVGVGSVLGTVSNETKKKEKNENVSEKIPPITEKIIKEAETAKSKEPTKETEKEAQNETSMFENESEEEAPLILTDEVKNGKSTIINKNLEFHYKKLGDDVIDDAYETLILDVFKGNSMLFSRSDFVEKAWEIVDPIIKEINNNNIKLYGYKAGTWGPKKCDDLFRNENTWRYPCSNLVNDGEICEL